MRKVFVWVLCVLLGALSVTQVAAEGVYPTAWDLTDLYKNAAAWYESRDELNGLLNEMDDVQRIARISPKYSDKLKDMEDRFYTELNRLYVYEQLLLALDPSDTDGLAMSAAYSRLEDAYYDLFGDYYEEDAQLLNTLSDVLRQLSGMYSTLTYDDIAALYADADEDANPYEPFLNTYAALLNASIGTYSSYARAYGYSSARQLALDLDEMPEEAYELAFAVFDENLPLLNRYLLCADDDFYAVLGDYSESFTYDEAVEQVESALAILGDDYVAKLDEILRSGHVDAYPSDTKPNYSFSLSTGGPDLPYVLLSFTGTTSDVSTMAHEFGHAMYDYYAGIGSEYINTNMTTYVHEVASTTNEFLYYFYRLENAQSDAEYLYLIDDMLYNLYYGLLFDSAAMAEMEDQLYDLVEKGYTLDAETVNSLFAEAMQKLYGDVYEMTEEDAKWWPEEAHLFLYGYYMIDYVTAVNYAADIAYRIYCGEEGALEAYRSFLSLGSGAPSSDLLEAAGVDVYSKDTYEVAYELMEALLDECDNVKNPQ